MLNVGVIGTGMIGQDHIRRMTTVLSGVAVTAVSDVDSAVAADVGGRIGATVHATGEDVVADPNVDAVLVCSWGPTHEQYVLAAIAAGKPVFCEKPLATTQDACLRIVEAEVAYGSRLVQVGYMRRFDFAYRQLKLTLESGEIGSPLMMHCAHRNASVPPFYQKEMAITDTAVHEIDMVRWMFGEEIAAARVLVPRKSRNGGDLQDPLLLILEMASGVIVDVELSVNIRYGYDIRGEIVGEDGTAALGSLSPLEIRTAKQLVTPVPADWRERFLQAYDVELQEWVHALALGGRPLGPTAWDGYAAAVVSDAGVAALRTGERVEVTLAEQPKLYLGVSA
ncbi:myo-inositol 2-dehydrogenase/D-chiro-inositol 1-dehydrogenase [Actinoplanes tereljensis]|uniref:Inositol 2-dehydrogenase n=1 Tax=Paractinoplanes tereljensis TaxID=571912 RepID=A0A919NMF4_9ACTN|nr:Gfo/Idh/MocA family oxidoreductase [Actinoplanes tereljensis]GIF20639.1 inositol 2-dehydrogenase [Actinoplanes tereljensis]